MSDLQQQAEGHRFETRVNENPQQYFWSWGTENSYQNSKKVFQDFFFNEDMENTFPKNVHEH